MASIISKSFRQQWLTGSFYFPQFLFKLKRRSEKSRVCELFIPRQLQLDGSRSGVTKQRLLDNEDILEAGTINTRFLANGDYYTTKFVEVDPNDLISMLRYDLRGNGSRTGGDIGPLQPWVGNYPKASNPYFYQGISRDPHLGSDEATLYRGLAGADWIALLRRIGVL